MQYPTVPQIDVLQSTLSLRVRECGRISECGKYLLVDSGIRQFFFCGSRYPGLWNPGYSSRNQESTDNWNPESKFHWLRIQNPVPWIRNPWRGIQNPRLFYIPGANFNVEVAWLLRTTRQWGQQPRNPEQTSIKRTPTITDLSKYIDLASAKRQALDNIYSLLKQHV